MTGVTGAKGASSLTPHLLIPSTLSNPSLTTNNVDCERAEALNLEIEDIHYIIQMSTCLSEPVGIPTGRRHDYDNYIIMRALILFRMISPKVQRMQRSIRINEGQLLSLAEKARLDSQ